ncbi:hypothetical protein BC940DRAFT_248508, partial [Gongronella butleri]
MSAISSLICRRPLTTISSLPPPWLPRTLRILLLRTKKHRFQLTKRPFPPILTICPPRTSVPLFPRKTRLLIPMIRLSRSWRPTMMRLSPRKSNRSPCMTRQTWTLRQTTRSPLKMTPLMPKKTRLPRMNLPQPPPTKSRLLPKKARLLSRKARLLSRKSRLLSRKSRLLSKKTRLLLNKSCLLSKKTRSLPKKTRLSS